MKICCPKCAFTRDIPDASIPASAQMATCPKCGARFNFRQQPQPEDEEEVTPEMAARRYEGVASLDDETPEKEKSGNDRGFLDIIEALDDRWDEGGQEEARQAGRRQNGRNRPVRNGGRDGWRRKATPPAGLGEIPWENARGGALFSAFFATVSRAILSAPKFFSSLEPRRSPLRALIFYILVNLLPTFVTAVYVLGAGKGQIAPYLEKLDLSPDIFFGGVLAVSPFQALASLLFFSLIINGLLHLLGVTGVTFNKTLRIVAYAGAPIILSFIPVLGSMLSLVVGLMILGQGLHYGYAASWKHVLMSILPPYLLVLAFLLSALRVMAPALFGAG